MHMRRCTQRPPMRSQSSQPWLEGSTSTTVSRWPQAAALMAPRYRAPDAFLGGPRHREHLLARDLHAVGVHSVLLDDGDQLLFVSASLEPTVAAHDQLDGTALLAHRPQAITTGSSLNPPRRSPPAAFRRAGRRTPGSADHPRKPAPAPGSAIRRCPRNRGRPWD